MDILKSFKTYFTIYKMEKYISSYVKIKFEKIEKLKLSHIDRKLKALAI